MNKELLKAFCQIQPEGERSPMDALKKQVLDELEKPDPKPDQINSIIDNMEALSSKIQSEKWLKKR